MCSLLAQQWYQCTSDVQERRSYLLLTNETVYVPVHYIVQETTLQFDRVGLHSSHGASKYCLLYLSKGPKAHTLSKFYLEYGPEAHTLSKVYSK